MAQERPEKISDLDSPQTIGQDFLVPVADPGVDTYKVVVSRIGPRFNVLNYAGSEQRAKDISSGQADPTAAFAAALAAASSVGGTVYVPHGTYGTGAGWTAALPSGVSLEGDGDASILVNCYMSATGSAGGEIAFAAPAAKGASTISIPATGLTGSWLRLSSCINMQSTDAGRDQLGHDPSAAGFLGEFVQVLVGSAGSATLSGGTVWPYSNTPGGDSGSFTTSVARAVTFHSGSIRKVKFLGKNSAQNQNIQATLCKGLVIDDVTFDSNDITNQCVRFLYCLDCHVRDSRLVGKRTSVPAGSTANPFVMLSSQGCTGSGLSVYYGNQGVDIDCMPNDATYRGGPSIGCGVVNSQAFDCATDGFTSHWGCYGSFVENVRTSGCARGVRLRDRGSSVRGAKLVSSSAGVGIGVLVDNAATMDSEVTGCEIVGFLEGIQYDHSATGYATLESLLGNSLASAHDNKIRDCADHGIYLATAYTSATMVGPRIVDNDIQNCTDDAIQVNSYWNGTVVDRNRITTVPTTMGGVRYNANIKRLYIGTNHIFGVNATGFAVIGAGSASFMTDAVTFPAGEAEAFLYIAPQVTDAATGFVFGSVIRDVTAQLAPRVFGFGPTTAPLGTSGPTVERATWGIYQPLSGSTGLGPRIDVRDASNNFRTYQMTMRGTGTPEAAVIGNIGDEYMDTATGNKYRKTSGTGTNTGWVTP